jgi:hypothetical protein
MVPMLGLMEPSGPRFSPWIQNWRNSKMVLVSAVSTTVGIRTALPLGGSGGSTIRSMAQPVWLVVEG